MTTRGGGVVTSTAWIWKAARCTVTGGNSKGVCLGLEQAEAEPDPGASGSPNPRHGRAWIQYDYDRLRWISSPSLEAPRPRLRCPAKSLPSPRSSPHRPSRGGA
ncbi:hypothetical protein E2562_018624 [Oryza meyeriana var. granulata]|uniref:Uncharacterized protein n=1 Tax=Oryza meyeriana var. granulata TaxID=110450 RepID=A0A6G1BYH8_9ORYZ|nr:hypothetical protein E2562_018624 [Oryza meyeriana var. granulata]